MLTNANLLQHLRDFIRMKLYIVFVSLQQKQLQSLVLWS